MCSPRLFAPRGCFVIQTPNPTKQKSTTQAYLLFQDSGGNLKRQPVASFLTNCREWERLLESTFSHRVFKTQELDTVVRQQQRIKKEPLSKSLPRAICLIFSWHAAPLPKCPAVFSPPVPAGSHGSTFPQAPSLYSHCSLFLARVFHCPSGKHILIKTNTMSAPFTEDSWLLETQRPLPPVCSPSPHRSTCNSSAYRSASPTDCKTLWAGTVSSSSSYAQT